MTVLLFVVVVGIFNLVALSFPGEARKLEQFPSKGWREEGHPAISKVG